MTITEKKLANHPNLIAKIRKVATSQKLTFPQAAHFLLARWFHLHRL